MRRHLSMPQAGTVNFALALIILTSSAAAKAEDLFSVQTLVSSATDPDLVNAWGISSSPTSPFWVSDNGTGKSTLYNGAGVKQGLVVTIPGDGSVTGQVFNSGASGGAFNNDAFLFVSEDGTISGWRGALGTNAETLQIASADNVYKGLALATVTTGSGTSTYAYAANFKAGTIDVLKGTGGAPDLSGHFVDPAVPSGYAPFNIQLLGGQLYVAYAKQGAGKDEDAGAGLGFVSVFDTQGNFIKRLVDVGGALNAPWGLVIAPGSFGKYAGDLLVGNFGDGTINAYNLTTGQNDGPLMGTDGNPLVIDGLWGLIVGNNGNGGSSQNVYFTAGPNDETGGAFGVITAVPEPGSIVLALIGGGILSVALRGRRNRGVRA